MVFLELICITIARKFSWISSFRSKIIYLLLYSILLIPLFFKKFYFFKFLINLIKILGIIRYLIGIKIKNYN